MQYIQQLLSRINLLYLCPFVQKILHLSLILCLVALTPMSAYAAGDSLTSSISLSFNSTKKFQLEPYEHFYAYYTVPSSYSRTKNTLSVTVSNLSNFSISVMNSDGSSISTTRKKNILSSRNASRQKSINNSSSRNDSRQKTANNSSSRNDSRQKATKSSSSRKGKTAATNKASTSSKKYVSSGTTLSPVTPAIHYIRLKKGTSIALAERIYTTVPNHPISFTPSSSSLHITDGIVYATSAGLFYIIIQDGSYSSSCTVKVDP